MTGPRRAVSLRDLLSAHDEGALNARHIPPHAQSVRDIALITDVDRILTVGPDSVVLLGEELALGGWVVSVALRYAWERRAVALIVSDQSFSETVVELARRFGVALFTTSRSIDETALSLARELGALEAGVSTRLDALHARVASAATIQQILDFISHELGDARVELLVHEIALRSAGRETSDGATLRVRFALTHPGAELAAIVVPGQRELAEQALLRAGPAVCALLLAQQLRDVTEAAPMLSFAALTGARERQTSDEDPARSALRSPWPSGTPLLAVALRVSSASDDAGDRIGPVVSTSWRRAFPSTPLARTRSGWFAFVPVGATLADVRATLRRSADLDLGPLGIAVGTSTDKEGSSDPRRLLERAWLAARLAEPSGEALDFRHLSLPLVRRVLPAEDARSLASATFPELIADPQTIDVTTSVVAYLDCAGSVTAAAQQLGVHRNTLQARLRRAVELGVPLGDPELLLSTHLLLTALVRSSPPAAVDDSTDH